MPLDVTVEPAPPAEGRWRLEVSATDDLGQTSTTTQTFTVNNDPRFREALAPLLVVRVRGKQTIPAGVTLTRSGARARHGRDRSGVRVGAIACAASGRPVPRELEGHDPRRQFVRYGGIYEIRFRATNELGAVELTTPAFRVIRAAPLPAKKPKRAG